MKIAAGTEAVRDGPVLSEKQIEIRRHAERRRGEGQRATERLKECRRKRRRQTRRTALRAAVASASPRQQVDGPRRRDAGQCVARTRHVLFYHSVPEAPMAESAIRGILVAKVFDVCK